MPILLFFKNQLLPAVGHIATQNMEQKVYQLFMEQIPQMQYILGILLDGKKTKKHLPWSHFGPVYPP